MLYKIILFLAAILVVLIGICVILYYLSKFTFKYPTNKKYPNIPAVPVNISEMLSTLLKLNSRKDETTQAMTGCSKTYKVNIDGTNQEVSAYNLMFGFKKKDADSKSSHTVERKNRDKIQPNDLLWSLGKTFLTGQGKKVLHDRDHIIKVTNDETITQTMLTEPEQFGMSWTMASNVYNRNAKLHLKEFSDTLRDAEIATQKFWPMIAEYGMGYNLLIAKKIHDKDVKKVKDLLKEYWTEEMETLQKEKRLFVIDMMFFSFLEPTTADGLTRFTPATLTVLRQDAETKELTPFGIWVNGNGKSIGQFYNRSSKSCTDGAWLYALQAAKTSITVYGIWFGHVYTWHLVSAAMQMTMFKTLPEEHPVYKLLAPQSKYLIAFDDVLLVLWKQVAPPTSMTTSGEFLDAVNHYAKDRQFFDDDPTSMLKDLGIDASDFTTDPNTPWNKYTFVDNLMNIWKSTEHYAGVFVKEYYKTDEAVKNDTDLHKWLKKAGDHKSGNIKGLPNLETRAELIRFLTSIMYRILAHGNSRLQRTANPALSFLANFPPCLQDADIPAPNTPLTEQDILRYLPRSGTIGQMNIFYFTFIYSAPYESFVPVDSIDADLPFDGGTDNKTNAALIELRTTIQNFISGYDTEAPLIHQWPKNIET